MPTNNTSAHPDSGRSVPGAEALPRLRVGSPRLAEPERAADFVDGGRRGVPRCRPMMTIAIAPAAPIARVSLPASRERGEHRGCPHAHRLGLRCRHPWPWNPPVRISRALRGPASRSSTRGLRWHASRDQLRPCPRRPAYVARQDLRRSLPPGRVGGLRVIGRDVLNHVRLLLDGPARNWEEVPSTRPGSLTSPGPDRTLSRLRVGSDHDVDRLDGRGSRCRTSPASR